MPFDTTIIILVAFLGFLLVLLIGVIALSWWRRAARRQAKPKTAPARRRRKQEVPAQAEDKASPVLPSTSPDVATPEPTGEVLPSPTSTPRPAADQPAGDDSSGDRIRILIVDDNLDTRENVSRLLYFENDMEVIGQAINGRQGIDMSIESKPHIVLMDINMPDIDGITATQKMSVDAPYSQVIIMSVQSEQHYMKQAMAAGARDFQPKPFTADELVSCIRRVYDISRPIFQKIEAAERIQAQRSTQPRSAATSGESSTPVIAVYSAKGGTGTSAIAANLAVALQQSQGDVVLVDADLQFGDISVNLNIRPTRTIGDLVHDGELDPELLPEVVLAHDSGLKVLLAPSKPQLADTIMPDMMTEIINGLKGLFKAVIVDTSSQLTDITLNVLENTDYILVVTAPELPAIKSTKLFLELLSQLESGPDQLGVIINRVELPGGVRPDQIAKVLKLQRSQPYLIPYDSRIYMAMYKGVLINQRDPGAPSAQAITQLATDVWRELAKTEEEVGLVPEVA